MKTRLLEKWNAIPAHLKLWTVLLAQIWFWPQCYDQHMPGGIGISLFITNCIFVIANVIKLVNSYDEPVKDDRW